MSSGSTRLAIPSFVIVLLTLIAAPAGATHTSQHANDQIGQTAAAAIEDMDAVVASYEDDIAHMDTAAEVAVAEGEADDDVAAIWAAAKKAIEDLVKLYPGELGNVGADAKQQILAKRQDSGNEISELADNWAPSSPTTTTTTVRPTTTTTANTTTTVGNGVAPPSGGNSGNSGNGGSGGNSGNSGGSGSGSGSSGAPSGAQIDPGPTGDGDSQSTTDPVDSSGLMVIAQTPAQAEFVETTSTQAQEEAGVTTQISGMLQTVLPPAIVDLVLSPLLILEILLRTSLADGQKILIPILLLALSAVLISVTDRRSKKAPRVMALIRR